jgi:hypothetical protein
MPGQQVPIDGDRNRDKLRASLNWQASEKLSLGSTLDYNRDNYNNTSAGLTEGKSWSLNLDGTMVLTEDLTTSVFFTHEDRTMTTKGPGVGSNAAGNAAATGSTANTAAGSLVGCSAYTSNAQELANAKIDPCLNWTTDTQDKINTLGLGLRHKGLMAGKLDLAGNLSYAKAVTSQKFPAGGVYVSTLFTTANFPTSATTWSRTFIPAADMPDVTSKIITLSVSGKYTVDKSSAVRMGYTYQRLTYDDWFYYNTVAGVVPSGSMPTMEKVPTYTIHAVGAAYMLTFR